MPSYNEDYRSFLLRMWCVKDEAGWDWRLSMENVETGELTGFASLDDLVTFLRQATIQSKATEASQARDESQM